MYEWVSGWGDFQKESIGNTHGGVVVANDGKIYFNTDGEQAIRWTTTDGKESGSIGKDLHGGLHGMALVKEGKEDALLLAHTHRHEVVRMKLDGTIVWTIPWPKESGKYKSADEYRPTSVAEAPDGSVFVSDGYGKSLIHKFDKSRKWVSCFGRDGKPGEALQTPHGLLMDIRDGVATLLTCDRENHRLVRFDLDGKVVATYSEGLRRPCNVVKDGDAYLVADLAGRVTVIDAKTFAPIAQLFDNPDPKLRAENGVARTQWKAGAFISPHGIGVASNGDVYVNEWLSTGRIVKLRRIKS